MGAKILLPASLSAMLLISPLLHAGALDVTQLRAEDVKNGVAVLGNGADFLWAVDAASRPLLFVDGEQLGPMKRS